MLIRMFALILSGGLCLHSSNLSALTVEQFIGICDSFPGDCSDHPRLHAYVGGALDLIATLDEETAYLEAFYCRASPGLFDVPAIIRFMERHREGNAARNAMVLVVRYLEDNGKC
ncbi:MAG: hypothetical protein WD071_02670 [Pseudohongiella sp.]|uniref:hypothetical protein n=1 Tax=Pseudohongiella sp. TaxID=1979412 RepID=UPI0034A07017